MRQQTIIKDKMREAVTSVAPLAVIILLLSMTVVPMASGVFLGFLVGCVCLTGGIGLFSLGAEMSMTPMGDYMGARMAKSRKVWVVILLSFAVGALITVSEPDLQVLATYVPSIDKTILILSVATGVGVFLVIAMLRVLLGIRLRYLLLFFYAVVFVLSAFVPQDFWAVAFDSGGVTTGPMTVPFIMTLGIGISNIRTDRGGKNDSFGFVALCSVGPIAAVLVLGLVFGARGGEAVDLTPVDFVDSREMGLAYLRAFPHYLPEILRAVSPIAALFLIYQWISKPIGRVRLARIGIGLLYTVVGLVLFLIGANVGFMPAGYLIGQTLGGASYAWVIVPIGMLIGYFIVAAEPAIHVLEKQVEGVTAGAVPRRALSVSLGVGVAVSVGISMFRALSGVSIMYFLAGGYAIALLLTFFADETFTSIAFDSGGVASGSLTATFLLSMAMGVCEAAGGNLLTDAFGIVAMVAMTPLISIQTLGVIYRGRLSRARRQSTAPVQTPAQPEEIIDF